MSSDPMKFMEEITKDIEQHRNEHVEVLCLALVREKGADSILDYELIQQLIGNGVKWYFQRRTVE